MGSILNTPKNDYSFLNDQTIDCVIGESIKDDSGTAIWERAYYDPFLVQQLCVGLLSMIVNFGVVYYHIIVPVHPKFQLRFARRWGMHIHVLSGLIEIFFGFSYWFVPGSVLSTWATVQCIASFIHCITAYYQAPIVFGVQAFMVPAYVFVVTIKWICAINLLLNPLCYVRSLVLFNILSIYAWVRVFVATFLYLRIFMSSHYSVAILMAGAVCLPGAGPAMVLFGNMFIFLYIISQRLYYGANSYTFLHQLNENTHNPFGNSMFRHLFKGAAGGCPFIGGNKDVEEAESEERIDAYLRPLFHSIDKAGDGVITVEEMKGFALNVKEPKLYSILNQKFSKYAQVSTVDNQTGIKYKDFKELAKGTVYSHGVSGLPGRMKEISDTVDETERKVLQAKLVFDVFNTTASDYLTVPELGSVLLEFGLPGSEVGRLFRMFDKNHDGKLEFDEFRKYFKPLWQFAYLEFARTYREEEADIIRNEKLREQMQSNLREEAGLYSQEVERDSLRLQQKKKRGLLRKLAPTDSERKKLRNVDASEEFGNSEKDLSAAVEAAEEPAESEEAAPAEEPAGESDGNGPSESI
mmetsp:Transcript_11448/g.13126  ORF Transcript_11448/g.13126 Transcript_11448/m.13126 type:complete len:580 (+) Transcript_11448:329-2068(+)